MAIVILDSRHDQWAGIACPAQTFSSSFYAQITNTAHMYAWGATRANQSAAFICESLTSPVSNMYVSPCK
jgi:hypothetical protein